MQLCHEVWVVRGLVESAAGVKFCPMDARYVRSMPISEVPWGAVSAIQIDTESSRMMDRIMMFLDNVFSLH